MDSGAGIDWNIRIDRIVIEGIPLTRYQQGLLKEALEAELGRMFAGRGISGEIKAVRGKVVGETIPLQGRGGGPVQLGKQVAASVYKSLSSGE